MTQLSRPTIGVLAGWQFYRTATNLSYLTPIFRGMTHAAKEFDCNLILGCGMGLSSSPSDPVRPAWPLLLPGVDYAPIGAWNTDGLIIANPLRAPALSQYIQKTMAQGHPVLFVGSGEPGPTIVSDNRGGILEAVKHLVEHGHRQIAFIAGTQQDLRGDSGQRLRAYQEAAAAYGLDTSPGLTAYGQHVYYGGYAAAQTILSSGTPFSALIASNDESALGAIQALRAAGRRVPEDVAVIGFDNRLEGAAHNPALTSVHVPLYHIGYHSLKQMAEHLRTGVPLPQQTRIATRLVTRFSCGCGAQTESAVDGAQNLMQTLVERTLNQAHNLTDEQCQALCAQLSAGFQAAVRQGRRAEFSQSLEQILQTTLSARDDANIWQEALSLLAGQNWSGYETSLSAVLDQARLSVSAAMQRQHRQYELQERSLSSHLSLLTARLLTALDEKQIFSILAQTLPEMGIDLAFVALFQPEEDDPLAFLTLQDVLRPEQPALRLPTRSFRLDSLLESDRRRSLTLIPLSDQNGQLGLMIFAADQLDLYGAIVQQLGGALNTARLYREATEGRRLAEEANRMKNRFLSTISHELRTPINLILGLSGIILRGDGENETGLPDSLRADIERVQTYAQHLAGLIGDVVDLATSDAGQLRLNNEYVNLNQTLRMVAESGRQLAADKGLSWSASFPEDSPYVWGDPTRLRQVALNLINNAIKFTERGGVSLLVEVDGETVRVAVRDTGLGILPGEQKIIFDEFRQSDRSIQKGYGGLGIGLAIAKRLVELHGGVLMVDSTGEEGGGSTIAFALPRISPPQQTDGPQLPIRAGRRVFVLTNHAGARDRLVEQLSRQEFQVTVFPVRRDADWRAQAAQPAPDTILLDLGADPAAGWETLKKIKDRPNMTGVPVVFFSSTQPEASPLQMDYLTKPIDVTALTQTLDQYWLASDPNRPARSILVVDDEPGTLEMHARIVQAHAASNRVLRARTGREAMQILHHEVVDLVLLDLQMPEMDGFEVLEAMRSQESLSKIPVIVLTGKIITETEMARLRQGVTAVLGKGLFSLEETVTHIAAALENKRRLSAEAQRMVRSAMAFLHENYAHPLSRQEIAGQVGITEDYLTFCFRHELGVTPVEYLNRYRIQQARRLLKETSKSVTEIALEVGFADSGYFSRIFRRETGMPPESFRRS